jgi:2-dehydro-3-deoxygalactonokinase
MILGVDWGSTSVRAMRIGDGGEMLEVRRADDGVFARTGDFAARLKIHLGDWLERFPTAPVLMCGMIGSDRGWVHAPYVAAPTGPADLVKSFVRVPSERPTFIVPGVSLIAGDTADVMRGEETLIAGLLAQTNVAHARVCLPGTHSKWVDIEDGRIAGFRTYMTGELRAALLSQGALATGIAQQRSPEAFAGGLKAAHNDASLSHNLFQARARRLLGRLPAEHTASFVSGLLIGDEVAQEKPSGAPLFLIARGAVAEEYGLALAGAPHRLIDPEPLAAAGLHHLARFAGLSAARADRP